MGFTISSHTGTDQRSIYLNVLFLTGAKLDPLGGIKEGRMPLVMLSQNNQF